MITNRGPVFYASRIELAETEDFDLGGLRVSPAHREVRMDGRRRELEPRVAQVLVALAAARSGVVSRDRLIEQCWDGRIVGDDAISRCILALRHLARDFSPEPFTIETVPRVGYSLVARPSDEAPAFAPPSRRAKGAIAVLLVLLLLAAVLAAGWPISWRAEAAPVSIAVMPFRNLSHGDPYFAEGVGEEILGQLAREPQFRVAGRASAAHYSDEPDARKLGRALGVDYVLEGSVRSGEGRVRINASLVQTSDGMQLWSEAYDRKLDDILGIQSAIGEAVAKGLRRKLVHPPGDARPVNGEAYGLYLNARGLLRSGNPQSGQDATRLLQEAIRLDPGFAAAWANLAEALRLNGRTNGSEGMIAILPQARLAADRALQLDPNLAQAHGVMAALLGSDTPEAIAHRRRAAALDPRSGEGLMWLAGAQHASGEFALGLSSYRQARDADPVWPTPLRALVDVTAGMGDRAGAEAVVRSGFADDAMALSFSLGRVAWIFGDYSEAVRRWSIVAATDSRWTAPAQLSLQEVLFTLRLSNQPPSRPPLPTIGSNLFAPRARMAAAPSAAEWRWRNRSTAAALVYSDENTVAAKLMLTAGRARELIATFDSPTGLLGIGRGKLLGVCNFQQSALVASALKSVGRHEEADALLRHSEGLIRAAYRRGTVPIYIEDDTAGIWAMQGRPDLAIAALERARRRGWQHSGRVDLSSLRDEPALRSLRGDPRFEALLSRYETHLARERRETAGILKIAA
jgi:TolB-like protein/DNA-binding winged helix-turn-helix (wHTH) protein